MDPQFRLQLETVFEAFENGMSQALLLFGLANED